MLDRTGGSDGARTRDLRRDRPAISLVNSTAVPKLLKQGMSLFGQKSERGQQASVGTSDGWELWCH